mmetsp:Transcript_13882/g.33247  ORF Transcript_13882/g.33247 Transcript_13882/m.33247 type:complete len:273 (-) Transcript_13882:91-909(-)|eukprot:CAMPEP_0197576802 /NCGR_PEP_ID=MMETSP1326-20131121/1681_1 /TAXON_ID=1155430 /ORGANISM="Genus nov. species nov., Strain RCC2288" /LENGTH=272 /DNA_ID=CAMNT_0043139775 /DNA_START=100 /DNA_END=918 /DNA_ORIENTATION=+
MSTQCLFSPLLSFPSPSRRTIATPTRQHADSSAKRINSGAEVGGARRWGQPERRSRASGAGTSTAEKSLFESVYEGLDRDVALELAEQSHKDFKRVPGDGWFYGELSFEGAEELLRHVDAKEGEVFLDMGSGLGKMVLAAALQRWRFKECRGVEILPELHEKAVEALDILRAKLGDDELAKLPTVQLSLGDMLISPWVSDADIVYCFATCFSAEVLQALIRKFEDEMIPGARLISISKAITSKAFAEWGPGYIQVAQAHSKWKLDCFLYVRK